MVDDTLSFMMDKKSLMSQRLDRLIDGLILQCTGI